MSEIERRYHETWLGMAQPIEGLVVSIPVLVDAQCMQRLPVHEHHGFVSIVGDEKPTLTDVPRFLRETLGYRDTDWLTTFPEELRLDVVEGQQTVFPRAGSSARGRHRRSPKACRTTPRRRAGQGSRSSCSHGNSPRGSTSTRRRPPPAPGSPSRR
jgi:hypothetical protein